MFQSLASHDVTRQPRYRHREEDTHIHYSGFGNSQLNFYAAADLDQTTLCAAPTVFIGSTDIPVQHIHRLLMYAEKEIWLPWQLIDTIVPFVEPVELLGATYREGATLTKSSHPLRAPGSARIRYNGKVTTLPYTW